MKNPCLAAVTVVLLAAGCGGAPAPTEALSAANASIRAAEVGGATDHPKAALHLKHARDQVEEAKRLIEEGENERAAMVLDRAEVDAEVALTIAQVRQARVDADEALEEISTLKSKLRKKK